MSVAAPSSDGRKLERLYMAGRLLTRFEGVEACLPRLLACLTEAVPVCSAVLAERADGSLRARNWHCPRLSSEALAAAERHALGELEYLLPGAAAPAKVERVPCPALPGPSAQGAQEARGQFVALPMVVERDAVFGVLQVQGVRPIDAAGLAFVSAFANQLSVAMDAHRVRAALERRVEQRTAELEEKVRELNTFAYSVAHDLRAPLRSMGAFSQVLLRDYGERLDARGRDHARRVVRASQRMDALIRDLLSYSQLALAEVPLETVALEPLCREVLSGMEEELAERGASVEIVGGLPAVRAHRATAAQVLANLLSNAVKFARPGVPPRVRVACEEKEGRSRLWVEDNGIGVAHEHHGRIFAVFHRLHASDAYPGTGIGLAIVRKAMERMGGNCGVESRPGQGSRFWADFLPEERT